MSLSVAFYTHVAAALGYGVFLVLLFGWGGRTPRTALVALAAGTTALWALAWSLYDLGLLAVWAPPLVTTARDASWLSVVLSILATGREKDGTWWWLAAISAVVIAVDALFCGTQLNLGIFAGVSIDYQLTRIVVTVLGLILVENLLRNVSADEFWAVKSLGIGLVAIFVFNLVARIPQFLTHVPDDGLVAAQPIVFLIVLPLFVISAVRNPTLALNIHSSRRIVFHTATLVAAGGVLQGTAVAAYYIRNYGGTTGTILTVLLVFSVLVVFAVAISSGKVRSVLRNFINENFFSYKYDYRVEWQKFIQSLSAWDDGGIAMRVLAYAFGIDG